MSAQSSTSPLMGDQSKGEKVAVPYPSAWISILFAYFAVLFIIIVLLLVFTWPPPPALSLLDLAPPVVTLVPGATQQFEARIWHARDQGATWTTTGGTISPDGFFSAPVSGTQVTITASSTADRSLSRSAVVLLDSTGLSLQPSVSAVGPNAYAEFRALFTQAVAANGATAPISRNVEWTVSDPNLRMTADGGTARVQAPAQIKSLQRVIVTAVDKSQRSRQASAVIYLEPSGLSLGEDVRMAELTRDTALIQLVLLMGALGALLGASRSFANFVGNGTFVPKWTLFYVLRPAFGAGLALLVFFGYRIGAITNVRGATPADPFAACFIAGMVGLFADTVLEKLRETILTVLSTKDDRRDKMTDAPGPEIDSANGSRASKTMKITGKNFVKGAAVKLNGLEAVTAFVSSKELNVTLTGNEEAGAVKVVVTNPDKHASSEFTGVLT